MKKTKLFWLALAALPMLIAGTGCKKFLDREPLNQTLNDLNQGVLESQSLGLYVTLRQTSGFSELVWLDFNSIRDDDAMKGSSQTDGAEINTEFETFGYVKNDWAPQTYWKDHYALINQANKELYFADSIKPTDEPSLRNVGEAYFFRAYSLFELVKTYGEVPIINFYFTTASAGIRPKSTIPQVYAQIDADLTKAAQYLPINWNVGATNQFPGRLTRGAALTLAAQTQLQRGNWAQVVSLCNQVKALNQYSLAATFPLVFKEGLAGLGKNGPESIFETQCWITANGASDYGNAWGTCQSVRQGGATNTWNLGWGWNVPTDKLVNEWPANDPRKGQTILFSGQSDGGESNGGFGATLPAGPAGGGPLDRNYWNKKVYSDPAMRQFTGEILSNGQARWINHRILRFADVLLMLAEASNELGDGATAATNLELVRFRASGLTAPDPGHTRTSVPYVAFVNQAQMRTAIKAERRFEFAMEGYRFNDLVRWGDAVTQLGSLGYTDRCKYYPIPQNAIDASGGVIVQNPQW